MFDVTNYESKIGGIILDSSQVPASIVTIKVRVRFLLNIASDVSEVK